MLELSSPLNIQVEITENCNHKCFYCYNSWQLTDTSAVISDNNIIKLIRIIADDIKPFHVTITGGEPLLYFDKLKILLKGLNERGIFTNINTNLILFNEQIIDELKNLFRFGVLTSLPHYENDIYQSITKKNTLSRFYRNLEIIRNNNIPITINMVVHKLNYKDVFKEGEFLYNNYGIINFAATPVICPALHSVELENYDLNNEEIIHVLRNLLKLNKKYNINVDSLETLPRCLLPEDVLSNNLNIFNRACSAGRSTISIDYKGYVRACSHSPIKESNIFEKSFTEIWQQFKAYRQNKFVPIECSGCNEFYNCYGGCRFYNYKEGDLLSKKDPRMTKAVSTDSLNTNKPIAKFDDSILLEVNQNIKYRKEKENLFVFFNGDFRNVILVNENFKDFILSISNKGIFSFSKFCNEERITQMNKAKLRKMFGLLISKKYLFVSKN